MKSISLYKKIMLKFLIFLTIPILLYVLFYQSTMTYLKELVYTSNKQQLIEVEDKFENIIKKSKELSLLLILDTDVQKLFMLQKNNDTTSIEYFRAQINILSKLANMELSQEDIFSIYLYNNHSNFLLSSKETTTPISNFHDTEWLTEYETISTFKILSSRSPYNQNTTIPYYIDKSNPKVISMIYPISSYSDQVKDGAVVINININTMDVFPTNITDQYIIANSNGSIITSTLQDDFQQSLINSKTYDDILKSGELSNYIKYNYKNNRYLLAFQNDLENNYLYLKLIPLNEINLTINLLQLIFVLITIGTLIIGIIYSIKSARDFYNPISKIVNQLGTNQKVKGLSNQNELNYIYRSVDKILKQDEHISATLEKQQKNIEKSNLLDMLHGKNDMDINIFKEELGYFSSIIISIDQYKNFVQKYSYQEIYAFKNLLLYLTEEQFSSYGKTVGVLSTQEQITVIIAFSKDNFILDDIQLILRQQCEALIKKTSSSNSFSISISIGDVYDDINFLSKSYHEALDLIKYRITFGYHSIISSSDLSDDLSIEPDDLSLKKLLSSKNKKEIKGQLQAYFSRLIASKKINSENVIHYLHPMVYEFTTYMKENNIAATYVFNQYSSLYTMILEQDNLRSIEQELVNLCNNVVDYMNKISDNQNIICKIMDIIEKNYKNPNLDIEKIIEDINMSYSYIRKILKYETGYSVNHHLNFYRIQVSKDLLRTTTMKIKDIAMEVGYYTDQSFNRYFKKYEKITASEYRKIHQN